MNTILTCIDGSPNSAEAHKYAAWAAIRLNTPVQLLHVVEHHREHASVTDLSGAIGIDANAELAEELAKWEEANSRVARLKGKASLNQAAKYLNQNGVLDVELIQRNGDFLETVLEFQKNAVLMIVGKRGECDMEGDNHLGANFEEVVRHSLCPVFVSGKQFRPIARFLVAFDNSESARKAIDFLCHSPLLSGMECLLLMVGHADAEHLQSLQEAAESLKRASYKVAAKNITGRPEAAIAKEAKKWGADLVLMGAYGHSKLREFFVGSTTTKLVQASPTPLMLFR